MSRENKIRKFLEFNGKTIYFIDVNGTNWIAIKPICEALNVNYNRQFQNLKEDEILVSKFAKQQILIAGDSQSRLMICLPEKYIYGWIFSINSQSPELNLYKEQCYEFLYEHFHGTITRREKSLFEKTKLELDIISLEKELQENETFKSLQELKRKHQVCKRSLVTLDREVSTAQLALFN